MIDALGKGFQNAFEDIKPEWSFVVAAGSDRSLIAKDIILSGKNLPPKVTELFSRITDVLKIKEKVT